MRSLSNSTRVSGLSPLTILQNSQFGTTDMFAPANCQFEMCNATSLKDFKLCCVNTFFFFCLTLVTRWLVCRSLANLIPSSLLATARLLKQHWKTSNECCTKYIYELQWYVTNTLSHHIHCYNASYAYSPYHIHDTSVWSINIIVWCMLCAWIGCVCVCGAEHSPVHSSIS